MQKHELTAWQHLLPTRNSLLPAPVPAQESMKPSCGKTLNYFRRAGAQKCKVPDHAPILQPFHSASQEFGS